MPLTVNGRLSTEKSTVQECDATKGATEAHRSNQKSLFFIIQIEFGNITYMPIFALQKTT